MRLRQITKWLALASVPLVMTMMWLGAQTAHRIMPMSANEEAAIAREAFTFGYPLVTTRITGMAFTNTEQPDAATLQAPWNQLVNQPGYPPATYRGVTAPNADTLYSVAFLDLAREPMVFSYPDMGKRYFLFPIYDAWTNVLDSAGTRTLGGAPQTILIAGPHWHGSTPAGMKLVTSPTNTVFVIGRVYSDGTPADMARVQALQKRFQLMPLSAQGKPYAPPPGQTGGPYTPKQVVRDVIAGMSTSEYFNFLANAMKDDPPELPRDAAMEAKMARIGLVPGKPFDIAKLSPEGQKELENLPQKMTAEFEKIKAAGLGDTIDGWQIPEACGRFGTDYRNRAVVSAFGWGGNLPEDAVYPVTEVDAAGTPLNGSNTYVMHFEKDDTPPVDGFWSITAYDKDFYFYPNAQNKQTVSQRNKLEYNPDGSLDLYFSHQKPDGVAEANWLPAPDDHFVLCMRMYWPKTTPPSILPISKPTWSPPPVKMQAHEKRR